MTTDPTPKKLNIGCGIFPKEGYVNIDLIEETGANIIHNLDIFPYPLNDSEFDLIEANHVLEHLKDGFAVMKELHRVGKNNATVIIRVPHFSRGFTHPDHKRGFDITFPYYFNKAFKAGYQGVEFELKKTKLTWFAQKYLKKIVMPRPLYYVGCTLDFVFSAIANLSPMLCSRLWCFWVGGFEEMEFIFKIQKKPFPDHSCSS